MNILITNTRLRTSIYWFYLCIKFIFNKSIYNMIFLPIFQKYVTFRLHIIHLIFERILNHSRMNIIKSLNTKKKDCIKLIWVVVVVHSARMWLISNITWNSWIIWIPFDCLGCYAKHLRYSLFSLFSLVHSNDIFVRHANVERHFLSWYESCVVCSC